MCHIVSLFFFHFRFPLSFYLAISLHLTQSLTHCFCTRMWYSMNSRISRIQFIPFQWRISHSTNFKGIFVSIANIILDILFIAFICMNDDGDDGHLPDKLIALHGIKKAVRDFDKLDFCCCWYI